MFDWDDLRFFIEVTRAKSLLGAAAKLGVNHTTVARRIQGLEESLAVRLFDKTPAGYRLTPTGAQLLQVAEEVETVCVSAQELMAGKGSSLSGSVRLSVPEGFGSQFLVRQLGDFNTRYPGIELEIVALPESLSISKREADVAITLSQPSVGRLVARALSNYTLQLYATREYLQRTPPVATVEDLQKHDLIRGIYSTQDLDFLSEVIRDVPSKIRLKSINAQLSAVEAGLGMSLLPTYMVAGRGLVAVLPERVRVTRTFWLSMHEDMRQVGRVKAVWDWLKEIAARNQATLVAG
jgi:DNA-binding transcriptional LysR family regulator